MRKLARTAVVSPADKIAPNAWMVSAKPGEQPEEAGQPAIYAYFLTGAESAADGFSGKALALEYARMKFDGVELGDMAPAAQTEKPPAPKGKTAKVSKPD